MGNPQWRYDALTAEVAAYATAGNITFESAKDIITFLSPKRTPGVWGERSAAGRPAGRPHQRAASMKQSP